MSSITVTFDEDEGKQLTATSEHFAAFWRDQFGTMHATATDVDALDDLDREAVAIVERAVDG